MKILILAGGLGNRLWPLTDPPKQFRSFGDPLSLLQLTLIRFLKRYPPEDLHIITNQTHETLARLQCGEIHPTLAEQLIIEPEPKNTAPAIAYALDTLKDKASERFLMVPSDHHLSPEESFLDRLAFAEAHLPNKAYGLFGVTPTFPHTGYGYITFDATGKVSSFQEKPSREQAKELIQQGCLWNTGMVLFHTETLLKQLPKDIPPISIDYLLLEKAQNLFVTHLDLSWSDLGSWEGIHAAHPKDEQGNVIFGNVQTTGVKNCLVIGGKEPQFLCDHEDSVVICSEACENAIMPLGTEVPSPL